MATPKKIGARPYVNAATRRAQYVHIARFLEATGQPWTRSTVAKLAKVSAGAVTHVIPFDELVREALAK
jgi:hypothetical protein